MIEACAFVIFYFIPYFNNNNVMFTYFAYQQMTLFDWFK